MTRPGKASSSSPESTRMKPASTTRSTWCARSAVDQRAVERGARRRSRGGRRRRSAARPARARASAGQSGTLHADDGQARRAELAASRAIDERLQVGPAARDQDADVHRVSELHRRVGRVGGRDLADREHLLARSARARRRASATRSAGTQTSMPRPMLKVRRISSGATPPPRASSSKIGGIGQLPSRSCSLSRAPSGSMRGGLSTRPAAGDVGGPAQQVGVGQRAQRADVDARRAQQRLAERLVQPRRRGVEVERAFLRGTPCAPASSRWSASPTRPGPAARRRRWMARPVDAAALLDDADAEAGQVVLAVGVEPGQLGGLAAEQRAAGLPGSRRRCRATTRSATPTSSLPEAK